MWYIKTISQYILRIKVSVISKSFIFTISSIYFQCFSVLIATHEGSISMSTNINSAYCYWGRMFPESYLCIPGLWMLTTHWIMLLPSLFPLAQMCNRKYCGRKWNIWRQKMIQMNTWGKPSLGSKILLQTLFFLPVMKRLLLDQSKKNLSIGSNYSAGKLWCMCSTRE